MRIKFTKIVTAFAGVLLCVNPVTTNAQGPTLCGAAQNVRKITQPDGSQLETIFMGNAVVNYTETVDGYSIVKNSKGIFEYATQKNGLLVPSGVEAHNITERTQAEMNYTGTTAKNIRYSKDVVKAKLKSFNALYTKGNQKAQKTDATFPNKGSRKVLMLLVQYPDLPQTNTTTDFTNLMNQVNYAGTGSYHDYYIANSFNQLDLTVSVYGWYMAAHPYAYYGVKNGYGVATDLGKEILIQAAAAGVNFADYDNDNDGNVDGVMFVHAGNGAEEGDQDHIWSHRGVLGANSLVLNGVRVNDYMFQPERFSTTMVGIGVFCHEFGHSLGLPDLYDVDGSSEGVGNYSVMGGGVYLNNQKTPACFDAWSKIDLGWMTATVIDTSLRNNIYKLPTASLNAIAYKIHTDRPNEYFLLENREKKGFDKYLPSHGLAIWHIDTLKTIGFRQFGNNNVNADDNDRGVSLIQADGKNDLNTPGNRGDAGDLYPGTTSNHSFTDTSVPASLYINGDVSKVRVSNITEKMLDTISFGYANANCFAALNPVANPGFCAGDSITLSSKLTGLSYQWFKDGVLIPGAIEQSYNVKTEGDYHVEISNLATCTSPTSSTPSLMVYESAHIAKPTVIVTTNLLTSSYSFGNHWLKNGIAIPGATGQNYTVTANSGKFNVVVTLDSICYSTSDTVKYNIVGINDINDLASKLDVYPNPASERLYIQIADKYNGTVVNAEMFDTKGALVYTTKMNKGANTINTESFEKGVYYLKLNNSVVRKIVVN